MPPEQGLPPAPTSPNPIPPSQPAPIDPAVPPAQMPVSPMTAVSPMSEPPRRSRRGLWVAVVLLAILLCGGGAAYFLGWFGFAPAPETIVAAMTQAASSVKSFSYDVTVTSSIVANPSALSPQVSMSINSVDPGANGAPLTASFLVHASGGSDFGNPANPLGHLVVSLDASSTATSTPSISLGLEVVKTGETSYMRLTKAPDIGFFSLKPLENQWVKIDPAEVASQFGVSNATTTSLSDADKQAVEQMFVSHPAVRVTHSLGSETVLGVPTYHYAYEVDKTQLAALLFGLENHFATEASSTALSARNVSQADIENIFANIDFSNGEVWMGKRDHLPYRVKLTVSYASTTEGVVMQSTIDSTYGGHNAPINVEIPTDARSVQDLMSGLLSGMMSGSASSAGAVGSPGDPFAAARAQGNDNKIKANLSSLRGNAEIYYANNDPVSYSGMCNAPKLDSSSLYQYFNPDNYPAGTHIKCNVSSDGQAYAVEANLTTGGDWCVDSTGNSKAEAALLGSATVCK